MGWEQGLKNSFWETFMRAEACILTLHFLHIEMGCCLHRIYASFQEADLYPPYRVFYLGLFKRFTHIAKVLQCHCEIGSSPLEITSATAEVGPVLGQKLAAVYLLPVALSNSSWQEGEKYAIPS